MIVINPIFHFQINYSKMMLFIGIIPILQLFSLFIFAPAPLQGAVKAHVWISFVDTYRHLHIWHPTIIDWQPLLTAPESRTALARRRRRRDLAWKATA